MDLHCLLVSLLVPSSLLTERNGGRAPADGEVAGGTRKRQWVDEEIESSLASSSSKSFLVSMGGDSRERDR